MSFLLEKNSFELLSKKNYEPSDEGTTKFSLFYYSTVLYHLCGKSGRKLELI